MESYMKLKRKLSTGNGNPRAHPACWEMLTSGSLSQYTDLLRKVVLDVELGREQVPLVYQTDL